MGKNTESINPRRYKTCKVEGLSPNSGKLSSLRFVTLTGSLSTLPGSSPALRKALALLSCREDAFSCSLSLCRLSSDFSTPTHPAHSRGAAQPRGELGTKPGTGLPCPAAAQGLPHTAARGVGRQGLGTSPLLPSHSFLPAPLGHNTAQRQGKRSLQDGKNKDRALEGAQSHTGMWKMKFAMTPLAEIRLSACR